MKGCTYPNCDCLEIAEQKANGPVKNYPCLYADLSDYAMPKGVATEKTANQIEKDLLKVRDYFGRNDKTTFEHFAYSVVNRAINRLRKLNSEQGAPVCDATDAEHRSEP